MDMPRLLDDIYRPMWNRRSLIMGFITGGLVSGGLLLGIDYFFRVVLIILGVMVFIDAIMVYGQDPHIVTIVLFAVVSSVLMYFLNIYGFGLNYLAAVIVIAIFFYFFRFVKR